MLNGVMPSLEKQETTSHTFGTFQVRSQALYSGAQECNFDSRLRCTFQQHAWCTAARSYQVSCKWVKANVLACKYMQEESAED